jgi:hypothetical protein
LTSTLTSRDEVHEKLVKAQNARRDGLPLPDEKVTLGAYLDYIRPRIHGPQ